MSDDALVKDVAQAVQGAPWGIVTILVGLYATGLKLALGRHYKAADLAREAIDKLHDEMKDVREEVGEVRSDMAYVKGRMRERWGDHTPDERFRMHGDI